MKNEPAGKRPAGGWLGPRPVTEGLRRGRDNSGSRPAVEIYGWQVREKPLSIKIPIDIVERLQDDIQYGLGMRTPCDVMGLLIGRVVKEYSATITIQDYVLAGYTSECVGSRLWSDERLADMIKPWSRPNSPTYVVGFFRSQSEDWPEIAKEDLKGAKKLLKRTPNVFLLIRSGLSRGYAGRLFLRPSWRGKLDEEYGEFPLNADILRSQWDATAPKREGPSLHFVPGNPLQGRQRPEPPRYIQDAVEAVFEPVMPSNEEVLAEASIHSVAVPLVEMELLESLDEPEVAKLGLWAKLFRRAEQQTPAFDTAAAATQPESVVETSDASMEPAKPSLWAKLFRRSTVETPGVAPIAINNAWETASVQPAEDMHSEIAAELPAMQEASSSLDAPPAKQSLWAKIFHRTTDDALPVVAEPVELPAMQEASSILDAPPAKQSLWAKMFHRTTEDALPVVAEPVELPAMQEASSILDAPPAKQSLWAKMFHRTTEDALPVVAEPVELPAMQEASSSLDAPPAKQSLWAKMFHRTTEDALPVVAEPVELPAMQEASSSLDAPPAKQSLWAKMFHRTTEDALPVVAEPVELPAMQEASSILDTPPAKQSLWAKMFHRTTEDALPVVSELVELPAIQEAPSIEPVAAEPIPVNNVPWAQPAETVQSAIIAPASELDARPVKQSLWAELFQSATEDAAPLVAMPAEAMESDMVSPSSELDARPAKQSLWAKLFHRTSEDAAPLVAMPAEAVQAEMIAPASELDAHAAKQSIWAKLFHRTSEKAVRVEPIAINNPWYMQEAPSIEPVAEANALDAPSSSPDPAQLSLWSKLLRPAEDEVEPISISEPLDTPWADADEVMATEEAWQEPEPAKHSLWAKLFRRATDETPDLEAVPPSDEWDTPWTDPTEAMQEEVSAEYPEEFESDDEAEPSKVSLWARLFRPTPEHPTPAEPASGNSDPKSEGESVEEHPIPAAAFGGNPPPPAGRHSWLAVAATWIVAVGVTMWVISGRGPFSQRRPEVAETRPVVVANPIGLQVDSAGGLLEIAWDPISVAAMTSSGGFLTIRDGNMLKEVRLDSGEIRSGHLYYDPRNPDLGIRLEVARDDGAMASESIRVVGPPPKGRSSDK